MTSARRILIVDGEAEMATIVRDSLTDAGHTVDAVPDREAALARLADGDCDLAILLMDPESPRAALAHAPDRYHFGNIEVDLVRGRVLRDGNSVGIPAKEMELLRYLIAHRGAIVSRNELLREVWNYQSHMTRTVDVHIAGLRQKIEANPEQPHFIVTVRGRGYLFRA